MGKRFVAWVRGSDSLFELLSCVGELLQSLSHFITCVVVVFQQLFTEVFERLERSTSSVDLETMLLKHETPSIIHNSILINDTTLNCNSQVSFVK